ncbi:hypothetical protein STTU_1926 [Streptomyces sp. Tu6071]|uniref:hypothetical protein n=1 Tax=Streptomyces sp. Tu6071 TaxID=355249 RepID=UPI00020E5AF4|nr:hypothetical protein [Streptomyces sp. Tu6071]EGJ74715.1 hypothetical protein STTU_1926 [Streptomyces sp. Tu6071]
MNLTVEVHQLFARRDIGRQVKRLAPLAAREITYTVPGRLAEVRIVVTGPKALPGLIVEAETVLLDGEPSRSHASRELRETRQLARTAQARAVPTPEGGAVIVVNAMEHRTTHEVAVTLVHELTHAAQFTRRGVLERIVRDRHDAYGLRRQRPREAREHLRQVEAEEREAYEAEYLADRIA